MSKTPRRILITPNFAAPYDQRMVNGLARGFSLLGQEAMALAGPVSAIELAGLCRKHDFDVVIQVNRTRHPEIALPPKVRYISWFQDVFPETINGFSDTFHDSDILYALGDASVLGLDATLPCCVGSLLSGVDPEVLEQDIPASAERIDLSLCGFIPAPPIILSRSLWNDLAALRDLPPLLLPRRCVALLRRMLLGCYSSRHNRAMLIMRRVVQEQYRPLRGELNIHQLTESMRAACASYVADEPARFDPLLGPIRRLLRNLDKSGLRVPDLSALSPFEQSLNYFAREYPRLLDRVALVEDALQVSASLELYGPGWDQHPAFRPYARGILDTRNGLLAIYRQSRINLANNTHGLGLHSRTLECMAVGGFVLTHASPHDAKPGGMLTSFEPGVHYGCYTPDTFKEEARRWLDDEKARRSAGARAAAVVRERHGWHHRAQQILDDLSR